MNYIDVKNFRKYEQLFGDNGPAKIGHVNAVIKSLNEAIANIPTGGLTGSNYVYVAADGTDVQNAAELQAAYTTAQGMSPSATNRITIVAAPGYYNFGSTTFTMSTQYIDLVSLDGNRSIVFNATLNESNRIQGSIRITANNVYLKGVDVLTKGIRIAPNLSSLVVENVKGGQRTFYVEELSGNFQGKFINCEGGDYSYENGFVGMNATFVGCIGGYASWFGDGGSIAGTFENCKAGNYSFFANKNVNTGVFTNCTAGSDSFIGSSGGAAICTNCTGGSSSFTNTFKLYYCRLTVGTFQVVTGGGVTVLCINGSNQINTQNT